MDAPSRTIAWCLAALALAAPGAAAADEPPESEPIYLLFESRLQPIGGPGDGSEAVVTFRLTDAPHGGQVLWTQGPQPIALRDGYFRVTLGDAGAPLSLGLFARGRWLEVDCQGCAGRRIYKVARKGGAVAIQGAERPRRPGPAAAKPWLRNQRLHDERAFPTGVVPGGRLAEAFLVAAADPLAVQPAAGASAGGPSAEASPSSLVEGAWTSIGPTKVLNGQTSGSPRGDVSGRVNSLAVHPTDPNVAYACGAQGGVWKTTDGGASWSPISDALPSLAAGAVAIAASDPNLLYLGTGEANLSIDSYWGAGIFKSSDAGATWSPTAVIDPSRAPINASAIYALAIHPSDPNVVLAAVGTFLEGNLLRGGGIYRTADGGASWTRALGGGLPPGSVVASDVVINPTDPNVVYAALGWLGGSANNGVWKSTNGGASFTKLAGGFPTTNVGRITLAAAPGSTQILYAAVHDISTDGLLGIWRSGDAGTSWSKRNASCGPLCGPCSSQCWYDISIAVSPTDPNTVFFGGVSLFRSTNAAANLTSIMDSGGTTGGLHVDHHALVFAPSSPGQLWAGNDGGVWKTGNASGSIPLTWQNLNGNLALLQFQSVAVPPADPNVAYGGTQDNGTNKYTGDPVWTHVDDGDGGQTAVDFVTPSTVYHTFFGVTFRRSDNGGATWVSKTSGLNTGDRSLFYVPVEMDPTNPAVLYLGTYRLHRTASRGDTWGAISPDLTVSVYDPNDTGEISAIGVGRTDPSVIYVGTSNGQVQVTSNLGGAWTNRTAAPLPLRYVTSVAVHPADANTAWVAFSGFDDPNTGDGHVFRTSDQGTSWVDATSNLPDVPVNQITIDPNAPQMIYLATDVGPYASANGGQTWRRYAGGFPNVATFEVAVQQPNMLFAATHGRGMFQAFGCTAAGTTDADADGVADFCDNCAGTANGLQEDADADGAGAACDCDDADPARHPGATDVCDGIDNDCDGVSDLGSAPPSEIADDLALLDGGDLSWSAAALAERYNVYRGAFGPGTSFAYNHACLASGVTTPAASDPSPPSPGQGLYYLVSSENCLAESGFGSGVAGPRPNASPCL